MTASKGSSGNRNAICKTYNWLKILQASKMKTKNQYQGCCQWSSWVHSRSVNSSSFRGGQFSWNFIRWRHRAYSTVVQLFRKRSHIIVMYYCSQTRSPQYKHALSAQRWLIKADKTEHFATALEAESPLSSEISVMRNFWFHAVYVHAQSNSLHIKYAEKTDD